MAPPRTRSAVTPSRLALAAAALVALAACGSDGTGPEQPLDGEWEMLGIFSDFDLQIQCWLTGDLTLALLGGGTNTLNGSGTHRLDCTTEQGPETIERTAPIQNGSYTGDRLGITLGFCSLGAIYRPNRPNVVTDGVATCNIGVSSLGNIAVIGSWEAVRVDTP